MALFAFVGKPKRERNSSHYRYHRRKVSKRQKVSRSMNEKNRSRDFPELEMDSIDRSKDGDDLEDDEENHRRTIVFHHYLNSI